MTKISQLKLYFYLQDVFLQRDITKELDLTDLLSQIVLPPAVATDLVDLSASDLDTSNDLEPIDKVSSSWHDDLEVSWLRDANFDTGLTSAYGDLMKSSDFGVKSFKVHVPVLVFSNVKGIIFYRPKSTSLLIINADKNSAVKIYCGR